MKSAVAGLSRHPTVAAFGLALALLFLLLPLARAEECVRDIDAIIARVNAAPNCVAAYKIIEDCNFGASGDVPTAGAVQEKCEAGFASRIDAAQKRAYAHKIAVCDRKYAKEDGTMYRAFEAFCRAEAAVAYWKRFRAR
jgi:hypothetical protein